MSFSFGNFNAPDMDDDVGIDQKKVDQANPLYEKQPTPSSSSPPQGGTATGLDPASGQAATSQLTDAQMDQLSSKGLVGFQSTDPQTGQLSSAGLIGGQPSFANTGQGMWFNPETGKFESLEFGDGSGGDQPVEDDKVDPLGHLDHLKQGFEDKLDDLWGQSRDLQQDQMAYNTARSNEIAGRMSSSVGGGYRGAQAQAELDNLQALKRHELDWGSMGLDFEANWINQSIGRDARDTQMEWDQERFGKEHTADLFDMYNNLEIDIPFEQFIQIMDDPAMGQQFLDEAAEKKRMAETNARDIQRDLGFDPDSLNSAAFAAYEAYLKNPNEETKAALEEALGGSEEDNELAAKASSFKKEFIAKMKKHGVNDINNTSDTQAKLINQMLEDAKTPEQLDAAIERAKAWMGVKELHRAHGGGGYVWEEYKKRRDAYYAKYGN